MPKDFKIHPSLRKISEAYKELWDDDIIRTNSLVGELGEYYVCTIFGFEREPVSTKGFDAKDNNEDKVEIKTRRNPQGTAKIAFRHLDFDYCYYVELNLAFEPTQVRRVKRNDLVKHFEKGYQRVNVNKMTTISTPVWERDS